MRIVGDKMIMNDKSEQWGKVKYHFDALYRYLYE
jgi:hypothetical protein